MHWLSFPISCSSCSDGRNCFPFHSVLHALSGCLKPSLFFCRFSSSLKLRVEVCLRASLPMFPEYVKDFIPLHQFRRFCAGVEFRMPNIGKRYEGGQGGNASCSLRCIFPFSFSCDFFPGVCLLPSERDQRARPVFQFYGHKENTQRIVPAKERALP